ncbi:MAG TPA: hypothetical protein VGL62_08125, partial [Vicinamibacterales bacterium]
MPTRVSLAELMVAGVQFRPDEAVAIVADICEQHRTNRLRGIPSPNIVRLDEYGTISAEGPVDADDCGVPRAAELLDALLPGFESGSVTRVSGALRLVVARGRGTLDLPPYGSLADFCAELERFSRMDPRHAACDLFARWREAAALTISDVRRARRATGKTLASISHASGVPLARLRELEWGYFVNWRLEERSRDWLARYAIAAGLESDVVIDAAWPLIEEAAAGDPAAADSGRPHQALVPAAARTMVGLPLTIDVRRRRASPWVAAAAAAALAVAIVPAFWPHPAQSSGGPTEQPVAANPSSAATDTVAERALPNAVTATGGQIAIEPAAYAPALDNPGAATFVRDGAAGALLKITRVENDSARNADARL